MSDFQNMKTAPKDGTEIVISLPFAVAAYWCRDLETWVLVRPLHVESVPSPFGWRPVALDEAREPRRARLANIAAVRRGSRSEDDGPDAS
jgi:hypothetical protein